MDLGILYLNLIKRYNFNPNIVLIMSLLSDLDKLALINQAIKDEQTGDPVQFARKLNVSRSMLYNYIEEIKTLGAKVKYNKANNTYYYENNFDVKIEVSSGRSDFDN